MTTEQIQHIIQQGESKTVEFKTCKNKLNKDAFDSICAFLNRSGGYLLLGVKDNGKITNGMSNPLSCINLIFGLEIHIIKNKYSFILLLFFPLLLLRHYQTFINLFHHH